MYTLVVSKNSKSELNKPLNKNTKINHFYATIFIFVFFLRLLFKRNINQRNPSKIKKSKTIYIFLIDTFSLSLL